MSLDVATAHLGKEIKEAGEKLLAVAGGEPEKWWFAYELKDRARNGWSAGAMDIALTRLVDGGKFEVKGDQVRICR